jgi:hypothetical protein
LILFSGSGYCIASLKVDSWLSEMNIYAAVKSSTHISKHQSPNSGITVKPEVERERGETGCKKVSRLLNLPIPARQSYPG